MYNDISKQKRHRVIIRAFVTSVVVVWKYVGPLRMTVLGITTILAGLVPACNVYVGKLVLDAIAELVQSGAAGADFSPLLIALGAQLSIMVVGFGISQCNMYVSYLSSSWLALQMNCEILQKSSDLDYSYFDNAEFHDVMTRAQRQASIKPLTLMNRITSILRGVVTFVSMAALVCSLSWSLFAVMIIVVLPVLCAQMKFGRRTYELEYSRTEATRMASYLSGQIANRTTRPEILSLGIIDYLYNRWYETSKRFRTQNVRLRSKYTLLQSLLETVMFISQVGATAYIVFLAIMKSAALSVGSVMMYSRAFTSGMGVFRMILTDLAAFYEDALFLNDLATFNQLVQENNARRLKLKPCEERQVPAVVDRIEFQNVTFAYPGCNQPVLRNVNLTFSCGESCLLAGSNGAGKTTLIKLLIRLYEPTKGRILINGVDAREYNLASLRKAIGVIFQQYLSFAFPARENIGVGCIDAIEDMERIKSAARRAKADSFIEKLPDQYDTCLSRVFTGGTQLSGGQWQRICLARLFMKDSRVFVFDEPTASLDVETEVHLLREITQLAQDRLCILISHRSLRRGVADRIVLLHNGCVAEEGTYDELVAMNGQFARLSRLYHTMGKVGDEMGTIYKTDGRMGTMEGKRKWTG